MSRRHEVWGGWGPCLAGAAAVHVVLAAGELVAAHTAARVQVLPPGEARRGAGGT